MRLVACDEIDIDLEKGENTIMGLETIQRKENEIRKHISNGYNEYKDFEGKNILV